MNSKYTLHVTNTDNGWVGHAMESEKIVFTTTTLPDPQACSQALIRFVSSRSPSRELSTSTSTSTVEEGRPLVHQNNNSQQPPVKKCCGRS